MDKSKHSGVLIHEVIGSSLAEIREFKRVDFIQAVNGKVVTSKHEVFEHLSNLANGQSVNVTVLREGQSLTLRL
jgi:S1-C subfamily serine protease